MSDFGLPLNGKLFVEITTQNFWEEQKTINRHGEAVSRRRLYRFAFAGFEGAV